MNTKEDSELKETTDVILDDIVDKDFPSQLEKWINDNQNRSPLSNSGRSSIMPKIFVPYIIDRIKDFQKNREPEILGDCILIAPLLLENSVIRSQVIMWIQAANLSNRYQTVPENFKTDIVRFANGLIPKVRKENIGSRQIKFIKSLYPFFIEKISNEFQQYKKAHDRQRLFSGDRSRILKEKIFPHSDNYQLTKQIGNLYNKSFNNYIEELAFEKKPSVIAIKLVKDLHTITFRIKIGEKKIRLIIKASQYLDGNLNI